MKVFRKILKWLLRILLGIVGLLLLAIIVSFLFRGKITDRVVEKINASQPGTIEVGNLGILPFIHFPDLSVRLTDIALYEGKRDDSSIDSVPVLSMEQLFASVNVRSLVRGDYRIREVRLGDGEINYIIGNDSISNLEKALGIQFGADSAQDTTSGDSKPLLMDLAQLQVRNLSVRYLDEPANTMVRLNLNGLRSTFSIDIDTLLASLMMHVTLEQAQFDEIVLDKPREVSLNTGLVYDQLRQQVFLDESLVDLEDATFEVGGEVSLDEKLVSLNFEATNRGIELLNFLLNGVLKLDDVEQTGDGNIYIGGTASGSFDNVLPEIHLDFSAEDIGFMIHSIDQEVAGIAFTGHATNGTAEDLSEARIQIEDFHVDFPEGSLDADIEAFNFTAPEVMLAIEGTADLSVLNEILDSKSLYALEGNLRFSGNIDGEVDIENESFLEDAGEIIVELDNVGFRVPDHSIEQLYGKVILRDESILLEDMVMDLDNNEIEISGMSDQLLPFLMDFPAQPSMEIAIRSDRLDLESITGDTLLEGPLRDLHLELSASIRGDELKYLMDNKGIPDAQVEMKHFSARIPGYTEVSDLSFSLALEGETLRIIDLDGMIGESDLGLQAEIVHYQSFLEKDTLSPLSMALELDSRQLFLGELLTWQDSFMILPELYEEEYVDDLRIQVEVKTKVGDLLKKNALPNVHISGENWHWEFRNHPMRFSDIGMNITLKDSVIKVDEFHGRVGESNLEVQANLENLFDTTQIIKGSINAVSELLDLNQLLNYELFTGAKNDMAISEDELLASNDPKQTTLEMLQYNDTIPPLPPDLSAIDFPDLDLSVDVGELRFEGNLLYDLNGALSLRSYKILYLDQFSVRSKSGGTIVLDGQFNVSDPELYMLSANMDIDTVNISDFDVQLAIEDTIFSLVDNFNGILSTDGIAEFFLNPDLSINVDYSTAMFNVRLEDGRVKNFTPLQALGKFTGNTDLDNVKFGSLRNSFTLIGGNVMVPLMAIESNLGLILLEGEQSLSGDFLYLARVPPRLVRGTAWNVVTNQQRKEAEEAEIQRMQSGKFLLLTIASRDGKEEVKMGDKRENY